MKIKLYFALCLVTLLGACVIRAEIDRLELENMPDGPSATEVQIVHVKPQGCQFVAGLLGDQNGGEPNHYMWEGEITADAANNIRTEAVRLGGNVVYLQNAYMGKPDISNDYLNPFYINGVQYRGLIYKCP